MSRADDPMQPIRWRHVDSKVQQSIDEARVLDGVNVRAVVPVIVDCVTICKVNLKHRPKALHDGSYFPPFESFSPPGDGSIAQSMQFAVRRIILCGEQVDVRRNDLHSQAMPIEGSVLHLNIAPPP